MSSALLEARDLAVRRGGRRLLRGLSFSVRAGEALAVEGANGCGKSSLLRALAGWLPLDSGMLTGPASPQGRPGEAPDLAYLGHQNALSPDLTARENLALALRMSTGPRAGADLSAALARVGLGTDRLAHLPVRRLSQGQQRRLAIARISLSGRRLWLLDEPTAALDAEGEALLLDLLHTHLAQGGAAVIATHHPLALTPLHRLRLSTRGTTDDRHAASPALAA